MVLWHVTSYRQALALEYQRLQAIARLQQDYGHYLWRWRAPLQRRLALRPVPVHDASEGGPIQRTKTADVRALLPRRCFLELPRATKDQLSQADRRLVEMARAISRDAKRQRRRLSQTALAREMRARGQPIANDRLRWLIRAAGAAPPEG